MNIHSFVTDNPGNSPEMMQTCLGGGGGGTQALHNTMGVVMYGSVMPYKEELNCHTLSCVHSTWMVPVWCTQWS